MPRSCRGGGCCGWRRRARRRRCPRCRGPARGGRGNLEVACRGRPPWRPARPERHGGRPLQETAEGTTMWKWFLLLVPVALVAASSSVYTVDAAEYAYLTQFGRPIGVRDGGDPE